MPTGGDATAAAAAAAGAAAAEGAPAAAATAAATAEATAEATAPLPPRDHGDAPRNVHPAGPSDEPDTPMAGDVTQRDASSTSSADGASAGDCGAADGCGADDGACGASGAVDAPDSQGPSSTSASSAALPPGEEGPTLAAPSGRRSAEPGGGASAASSAAAEAADVREASLLLQLAALIEGGGPRAGGAGALQEASRLSDELISVWARGGARSSLADAGGVHKRMVVLHALVRLVRLGRDAAASSPPGEGQPMELEAFVRVLGPRILTVVSSGVTALMSPARDRRVGGAGPAAAAARGEPPGGAGRVGAAAAATSGAGGPAAVSKLSNGAQAGEGATQVEAAALTEVVGSALSLSERLAAREAQAAGARRRSSEGSGGGGDGGGGGAPPAGAADADDEAATQFHDDLLGLLSSMLAIVAVDLTRWCLSAARAVEAPTRQGSAPASQCEWQYSVNALCNITSVMLAMPWAGASVEAVLPGSSPAAVRRLRAEVSHAMGGLLRAHLRLLHALEALRATAESLGMWVGASMDGGQWQPEAVRSLKLPLVLAKVSLQLAQHGLLPRDTAQLAVTALQTHAGRAALGAPCGWLIDGALMDALRAAPGLAEHLPQAERRTYLLQTLFPSAAERRNALDTPRLKVHRRPATQLLQDSMEMLSKLSQAARRGGFNVRFHDEEGTGPGVTREWLSQVAEQLFDPCFALFTRCNEDQAAVHPHTGAGIQPGWRPYMRFAGRIVGLALRWRIALGIRLSSAFFKLLLDALCTEGDADVLASAPAPPPSPAGAAPPRGGPSDTSFSVSQRRRHRRRQQGRHPAAAAAAAPFATPPAEPAPPTEPAEPAAQPPAAPAAVPAAPAAASLMGAAAPPQPLTPAEPLPSPPRPLSPQAATAAAATAAAAAAAAWSSAPAAEPAATPPVVASPEHIAVRRRLMAAAQDAATGMHPDSNEFAQAMGTVPVAAVASVVAAATAMVTVQAMDQLDSPGGVPAGAGAAETGPATPPLPLSRAEVAPTPSHSPRVAPRTEHAARVLADALASQAPLPPLPPSPRATGGPARDTPPHTPGTTTPRRGSPRTAPAIALSPLPARHTAAAGPEAAPVKQLLVPLVLEDLQELDEEVYRSCKALLVMEGVEQLGLTFTAAAGAFGSRKESELVHLGAQTLVTDANKEAFVAAKVRHHLADGCEPQLRAFAEGLRDMVEPHRGLRARGKPAPWLLPVTHADLNALLGGEVGTPAPDDWRKATRVTCERGGGAGAGGCRCGLDAWFWRAVASLDEEQRRRLLRFWTGVSHLPAGGFACLGEQLRLYHVRDEDPPAAPSALPLPKAHVCFSQLLLPGYKSYDQLRRGLVLALEHADHFGEA